MSPPWSKPLEVDRLADGGAEVDFAIPLAELSGVRPLRAGVAGSVAGARAFYARSADWRWPSSPWQARRRCCASAVCSRMQLPLRSRVRVALVTTEAEAARVPEELEPMLAPGGRISIGELVAEELLLACPSWRCTRTRRSVGRRWRRRRRRVRRAETHRPFAQLGDLLKR